MRRIACLAVVAGGLVLPGCGGGSAHQAPRHTPAQPRQQRAVPPSNRTHRADPAATRVVEAWSTALRTGHVDAAARYFALPSLVENGTPPQKVATRGDARSFNASLPCGAVVRRAVGIGRFTVVVFQLTNRPGGNCAQGVGHPAATAFVIRRGKILEWRRLDASTVPPAGQQAPAATGPTI